MPSASNGNGAGDNLHDLAKTLNLANVILAVLAAGHCLLFQSPLSMGAWSIGIESIIAALFVYPLFVSLNPPLNEAGAWLAMSLWKALLCLLVLRGLVNRRPGNREHPRDVGVPMFGRVGGIALPAALAFGAWPYCPGVSWFIGWGFVAHQVHLTMINARFSRQAKHAAASMKEAELLQQHIRRELDL
ncbi:hypothetical protein TA3x_000371 [Tundrisphaera sp. TA3]|uniref:hypothetical protein n=1 Tax=Tundrisphaera sp. TA3 TaxID=3435775 RepID=UPI003EB9E63A